MRILLFFACIALVFSCNRVKEKGSYTNYIKVEYLGLQDSPFTVIVLSTDQVDKRKIGIQGENFGDTLWIENIIINKNIYDPLKEEIISLSQRNLRTLSEQVPSEKEAVGFNFEIIEGGEIFINDNVWTVSETQAYFRKLVATIKDEKGSENVINAFDRYYLNRIFPNE